MGQNAAAVVIPNLDGTQALQPVKVTAAVAGRSFGDCGAACSPATTGGGVRLVGLVSFFVGCSGRAYFGSVSAIASQAAAAPVSFPAVGESAAATQLATSAPELVYTTRRSRPNGAMRNPA